MQPWTGHVRHKSTYDCAKKLKTDATTMWADA